MTQPNADSLPDFTGHGYLQVLQTLHEVLQPRNYLEIGTFTGQSLALAACASLAVDPGFPFEDIELVRRIVSKPRMLLFRMASDLFFQRHDPRALLGDGGESKGGQQASDQQRFEYRFHGASFMGACMHNTAAGWRQVCRPRV